MSSNIPETPTWPSLYDPFVDLLRIPHNEPVQPRGHYLTDADDIFRFTLYWTFIFYLPLSVLAGTFAFLNIAFAPKSRHKRTHPTPFDVDDGRQRQQHEQLCESHPLAPLNTAVTRTRTTGTSSAASPTSAGFLLAAHSSSSPSPASPSGTAFAPKAKEGGEEPHEEQHENENEKEEAAGVVPNDRDRDRSRRGTSSTVPASLPASLPASALTPAPTQTSTAAFPPASAPAPVPTPAPASPRTPPKVNPHRSRAAYALIVLFTYLGSGLLGAVVGSTIVGYVLAALYKSGGFFMSTWIPPLFALTQTLIGVLGVYPSIAEII